MSTVILLTLTGLALAAMYFLLAAGLSLIFGLMDVLNFAHGAFFTWGAYGAWFIITGISGERSSSTGAFVVGIVAATILGAVIATGVEIGLLRPLYRRPVYQILITLGAGLALSQLTSVIWSADAKFFPQPAWLADTTTVFGARIP